MKKCRKCGELKEFKDFNKQNHGCKNGLRGRCKICQREDYKYYRDNIQSREVKDAANKRRREKKALMTKEERSILNKKYRKLAKDMTPDELRKKSETNKKYRQTTLKQRIKNETPIEKEIRLQKRRDVRAKNRAEKNEKYQKERIRKIIWSAFSRGGYTKKSKTYELLGCDFKTFKKHIERQFTKGMNWDNHGDWHYDHITPLSTAKDLSEFESLNHYTNIQPLWAKDNISKGCKVIEHQTTLHI